jgi:hypothetical protein
MHETPIPSGLGKQSERRAACAVVRVDGVGSVRSSTSQVAAKAPPTTNPAMAIF